MKIAENMVHMMLCAAECNCLDTDCVSTTLDMEANTRGGEKKSSQMECYNTTLILELVQHRRASTRARTHNNNINTWYVLYLSNYKAL